MAEDADRPMKTRAVAMTVWYSIFVGAHWLALASSARILLLALAIISTAFIALGIMVAPKKGEEEGDRQPDWVVALVVAINAAMWAWFILHSHVVGTVACSVLTICIAFTVRELWEQAAMEREYHEQEKRR